MSAFTDPIPLIPGVLVGVEELAEAIARRGPDVLPESLASTGPAIQPPQAGDGFQGDRTSTSLRSAIFIAVAATIAVLVLWWAKRRSDSRRQQGHYVHDGQQQRRELIAYNEALRQQRIQALVQTQVTDAEAAAERSALSDACPAPCMRPGSAPGADHRPSSATASSLAGPMARGTNARSFPGMAPGGLQPGPGMRPGGMGAGAMMQEQGRGNLYAQSVAPGVTRWGGQGGWGAPWSAAGGLANAGGTQQRMDGTGLNGRT